MPTTQDGLIYPASGGHTRIWEHLQALAESAQAALPKWAPQVQSLLDTEANVGIVSGDVLGSGTITLPAGWTSMILQFSGLVTLQFNAAAARGVGVAEVALEVGGTVAVPTYATTVEEVEWAMYHEIAAGVKATNPLAFAGHVAAADLPWRLRSTLVTPTGGSAIGVQDRVLKVTKFRTA